MLILKVPEQESFMWDLRLTWDQLNAWSGSWSLLDAWAERAWTLQEWVLSPRVLHINKMTQWDCWESYGNEMTVRQMEPATLQRNLVLLGESGSWEAIVESFTKRKITYDKDRLPALSGMAQAYQEKTGCNYFAGLWLEDMPAALTWKRKGEKSSRSSGFAEGSIPSWSWASVEAHVEPRQWWGKKGLYASIQASFCESDPPHSFLGVKKAWVDIEGLLTLVTHCEEQQHWENTESSLCRYQIGTSIDPEMWNMVYLDVDGWSLEDDVAAKRIFMMLIGLSSIPVL
ncbi:hypothetical protein IL306_001291 [Fusarium sp. DS 682]|nr:hypothetical protein IL306_001291 [Fusarium sp. DS 682]